VRVLADEGKVDESDEHVLKLGRHLAVVCGDGYLQLRSHFDVLSFGWFTLWL
jgi:hypothetical protein